MVKLHKKRSKSLVTILTIMWLKSVDTITVKWYNIDTTKDKEVKTMAKGKKKSSNKKLSTTELIILVTAIIELVSTVIDLITKLIE